MALSQALLSYLFVTAPPLVTDVLISQRTPAVVTYKQHVFANQINNRCFPCTTRQAIDSLLFNVSDLGFEYFDDHCRLPDDKPRVPADYVLISIFSVLGLITLISTAYDLWHAFLKKTDPKQVSVLGTSFSVYTNGRRLMTFNSSSGTIECLDGIRTFAMAWVVIGHAFNSEVTQINPLDVASYLREWPAVWLLAAHFTVDTFFFLSGFLVVYTTLGKLTTKSLLKNLHLFYLNRLLRMFPLLASAVLIEASLLNRMSDGPYWNFAASLVNTCRTTWWSTLLHIQNYVNPSQICIGPTWYLAVDVQLHILSPIVLVWVLYGKKKIAWTVLIVALCAVLTASTTYNYIKGFPSVGAYVTIEQARDYAFNYYVNTLTRASPFFVGMIFGYAVRVTNIKLRGIFAIIYWAAFFALMSYLMYHNNPIMQPEWNNPFMDGFYNSFFRSFWAFGIGCMVYACHNGFGGPINWFLSLQVWKIHARLSYAIYLYHQMLIVAINYQAIAPVYFDVGLFTFKFLAHYVYAFIWAFFMTLILDSPFSTLFKLLLGGGIKKPIKKDDDEKPTIEPKGNDKQV